MVTGRHCSHRSHDTLQAACDPARHPVADWPRLPHAVPFEFTVFDAARYRDTAGYCPGDDEVSRSIVEHGVWEMFETALVAALEPFHVVDVGAHIGWFSRLAPSVDAVEVDEANVALLAVNAPHARVTVGAVPGAAFVPSAPVDVLKVDIEADSAAAIGWASPWLDRVAHIVWECSPGAFDAPWAAAVDVLHRAGFSLYDIPDKGADPARFADDPVGATRARPVDWADLADVHQTNVYATR